MVSRSSEMARVESGQIAVVDQRRDVVLVLEARHGIVRLLLEEGARDAPGFLRLEQRQAPAMDQIVDEGGDEHRLAGAGQAGDAEPQRRREQPAARPDSVSSAICASSVKVVSDDRQNLLLSGSVRPDIGNGMPQI